jgi:hypothetical protein
MDDRGSVNGRAKMLPPLHNVRTGSGASILLSNRYQGAVSLGIKQPGCEAEH